MERKETGVRRHETGYEVARGTHDKDLKQKEQDKRAEAHLTRSTKLTWSGYEVANVTQETQNTRETKERSRGAPRSGVTRKRPGPSRYRQIGRKPNTRKEPTMSR